MANETGLGASFAAFTPAIVEEEVNTQNTSVDTLELPPPNTVKEPIVQEEESFTSGTQEVEQEEDNDAIAEFAKALGYEGEITGNDLNTLIEIAQKSTAPYKERVEVFEQYPILNDLAQHIKLGGTAQDFFQEPQETNYFQGELPEEDAVTQREELYYTYYNGSKLSEEEIAEKIEIDKEKGLFNQKSDKFFNELATYEKEQNEKLKSDRQAAYQAKVEEQTIFFKEVENAFNSPMQGVTVDKKLIEEARTASLPNNGKMGMAAVYENFTAAHEAILNTFALALSKGQPFTYNPTRTAPVNVRSSPVSSIINKTGTSPKGGTNAPMTNLKDISSIFNKKR